jgi:hypothetical protein
MKAFAELYADLDATTSSNAKLAAMQRYFAQAAPEDAAWAVYFLSGGRPRQLVPVRILRELAVAYSGLSPWLFEESYQAVGDLAETTRPATGWRCGSRTNCCPCAVKPLKHSPNACPRCGRNWTDPA